MALTKNQIRRRNNIVAESLYYVFDAFRVVEIEDDVYESLGKLLLFEEKEASQLYDVMCNLILYLKKQNKLKFRDCLLECARNIDIYNLLVLTRRLMLCEEYPNQGQITTLLASLINKIIEIRVMHPVSGLNTETGEVFVEENSPTMTELEHALLPKYANEYTSVGRHINHRYTDNNDNVFIESMIRQEYGDDYVMTCISYIDTMRRAANISPEGMLQQFGNFCVNCEYVNQMCRLFDEAYRPFNCLEGAVWKREDSMNMNVLGGVFEYINKKCMETENLWANRERLMRKQGVKVVPNEEYDGLNYFIVNELHDADTNEHYLIVKARYYDCVDRELVINMVKPSLSDFSIMFEVDYVLYLIVLVWLGMERDIARILKRELREVQANGSKEDIRVALAYTHCSLETLLKIHEWLANGYRYEEPQSWNYLGNVKEFNRKERKSSKVSNDDSYEYVIRRIGAYVRRLPKGQSASPDKIEAAKRYYLELKDGYTLVDGFERNQRVKVKDDIKRISSF